MKIALCSRGKFSLDRGSTKNRIELAESLQKLGWQPLLIDKKILGISSEKIDDEEYCLALKEYLMENAEEFDVVLYEYDTLPFERSTFNKKTLFVARPALLAFHLPDTKFRYNLRTKISYLLKDVVGRVNGKKKDAKPQNEKIHFCLKQADVIQVQNSKDRLLLVEKGFAPERIMLVPNGISRERIGIFGDQRKKSKGAVTIAFVGTFDFRKGAMDFPEIFKILKSQYPDVRLKLLGTKGLFQTRESVLRFFPRKYRNAVEVIPVFEASELPQLLSDCQIGLFPSYLESFGFGALEMMCAGLPVLAYDVPGPSDFVLPDLVFPKGDVNGMAKKIINLIGNEELLKIKGQQSRERVVRKYCWDDIAKKVDQGYKDHLQKLITASALEMY